MNKSQSCSVRFLSGSMLKLFAVICMLIDHLGAFMSPVCPWMKPTLFTLGSHTINVYYLFRSIGRSAFPLFCFLLAEGYLHTKNRVRYGITLLIGALVSEIPFNLAYSGKMMLRGHQNVFFTLLLGYLGICCYEHFHNRLWLRIVTVVGLFFVAYFLKADYGITGYGIILATYIMRNELLTLGIIGCLVLDLRCFPAYICMALYNGRRGFIKGRALQYAFYAFYPLHLLILYLIRTALL